MPMRLASVAVAALCCLFAQVPATPPAAKPTLAAAQARLQAQDPAGAAKILEQLVAAEPTNGRAWRNLGNVYQTLKDYDKAIAAEKKALAVEPGMPSPLYALGDQYALEKNNDQAFAWLQKARDTHRIDMTQMEGDTDLDGLRADPRYKALLPTAADFANPFVEPTTILHEWDGEVVQRSVRLDRAQHRRRRR